MSGNERPIKEKLKMENGGKTMARFWERLAIAAVGILTVITLGWTNKMSETLEKHTDKLIHRGAAARTTVWVMKENMRNIHHEQVINRRLLNRIDKNTGGKGDEPPVRDLLTAPDEMRPE